MTDSYQKPRYFQDPQSGQTYLLVPEQKTDTVLANISASYLMLMLIFFLWLLVDAWLGKYTLMLGFGELSTKGDVTSPFFKLAVYSFVGGGLGGIVNGFRSIVRWHCELRGFGRRFVWKYITLPWLGATLGLFVFAIMFGGVAVVAGDISTSAPSPKQIVAMFGIGALAGFGSRSVFKWLDAKVADVFKTKPTTETAQTDATESVPDLIGMTKQDAENAVSASNLIMATVTDQVDPDKSKHGTVIAQYPLPGSSVASGTSVHITIATDAAHP